MTGRDVPHGGTGRDGPVPGDETRFEELLAGVVPADSEDEMDLAGLLDALRAPGTPDELSGADQATAAFVAARAEAVLAPVVPLASRRRPALAAGAAVAGATAVLLLAGTAAAAFTGSLPGPLQRFAHDAVGAPAPHEEAASASSSAATDTSSGSVGSSTRGPAVTPSAAALAGLCQAYADRATSDPALQSTAYLALKAAATKDGKTVVEYCAPYVHAAPSAKPSVKPSNKPTAAPSNKPTAAPSNKPTVKPTVKPTSKPTPVSQGGSARPSVRPTGAGVHATN